MEPGTRVRVVSYPLGDKDGLVGRIGTVLKPQDDIYIKVSLDNPPEHYAYYLFNEAELEAL